MGISIQQANSMSYFSNTNQVLRKSSGYNESVVSLQKDLTAMGYSTNGVDGYFGDDTKAAVTAFQNAYGLDADGIAGSQTLGKINELINGAKATTVVAPKPTPVYDSVSISGNLQIGSKGSAVTNLQEKLIRMGYNCGGYGPDGDFGTGTYNSVVQFQKNNGLTQDGIVGTQTSQAIANALKTGNNGVPNYLMNKINTSSTVTTTPSASTNITGTLQSGSKGNAVLELQKKLINMGYDCGGYGADGDFGTGTYKSVIQFQKDHGLTQDGIVGSQTNQAIANALKTSNNGVPNYIMGKINASSTGSSTPSTGASVGITVQSGSKGSAVVQLQKNLMKMGYDCGSYGADGDFGSGTYNAVKKFQSDYGLTQDGIAGPQTNQAIANALKTGNNGVPNYIMHKSNASSTASSTPSASITMQSGNKGSEVKKLQENLMTMGYDCGSYGADGDFGTGTYNAVKKFQSDYALTQDGIVGPQTNQAIANALKTGSNGVPNYIMHKINPIITGINIPSSGTTTTATGAPNALSVTTNFLAGFADACIGLVTDIKDAVLHPINTIVDTANGLDFLDKAQRFGSYEQILLARIILETVPKVWNDFSEGDADKKAKMIGRVVGEIVIAVVGTKGAALAKDAIKVSLESGKFAGLISDIGRGRKTIDKVVDALDDVDVPKVEPKVIPKEIPKVEPKVVPPVNPRFVSRVLDEIADSEIVNRVKEIRGLLPSDLRTGGNFAKANVEIQGLKSEFYAHNRINMLSDARSAIERVKDISLQPTKPIFKATTELTVDGREVLRDIDSEFKILNDVASKLGGNVDAMGKIQLFTELAPCPSCENVINEFLKTYKNITIEVIHNNGTRLIP